MERSTRPRMAALAVATLALLVLLPACQRTSDKDQQIADLQSQVSDLQSQVSDLQTELDLANGQLKTANSTIADLQNQLKDAQTQLGKSQEELSKTQAQLAQVGDVVLKDGTYVGPVLGAKPQPQRVIVFDAAGLYRVSLVAKDVTITSGGKSLSLKDFSKLLSSTDPNDVQLANGNYQVIVKNGLITSIKKSKK